MDKQQQMKSYQSRANSVMKSKHTPKNITHIRIDKIRQKDKSFDEIVS